MRLTRLHQIAAPHADFAGRGVILDAPPHPIHRDDEGIFDNPGTEGCMTFFKDPGGNTIALASRRRPTE